MNERYASKETVGDGGERIISRSLGATILICVIGTAVILTREYIDIRQSDRMSAALEEYSIAHYAELERSGIERCALTDDNSVDVMVRGKALRSDARIPFRARQLRLEIDPSGRGETLIVGDGRVLSKQRAKAEVGHLVEACKHLAAEAEENLSTWSL